MKISYNYEEMLSELKEDVIDGVLLPTDTIQVLRSDKEIGNEYKPIIDWYYDNERMAENFKSDVFDDEQEIAQKQQIKKQYEKDKPNLLSISVEDCILEMEEWNKIIVEHMTIGETIRKYRAQAGMSQTALAEKSA